MSFSVVIRCGRDWTPGDPCRNATPLGVVDDLDAGRADAARREGWSTVTDPAGRTIDRCPACTKRELEQAGGVRAVRQLPPAARRLAEQQLAERGLEVGAA